MRILFMDTETTGLPPKGANWRDHYQGFPFVIEIAWQVFDDNGGLFSSPHYEARHYLRPNGFTIPEEAIKIHGITQEVAEQEGHDPKSVFRHLIVDAQSADLIVGHNIHFDTSIVQAHLLRLGVEESSFGKALHKDKRVDTMKPSGTDYMVSKGNGDKWVKLCDLYRALFNEDMVSAHSALADVQATARCYFELKKLGFIK